MPLALVAYLRVSTDEQAESGLGLESQEARMRAAFEYRGWQLAETVRDEGVSGSTLDRPGLRRALELIAAGDADGLVVAKLDRLTRSMRDFCAVVDWCEDADAALVMLEPDVDTSTPAGRAVAQVMTAFAELERGMIADRTRAALAAKRARGESINNGSVADRPEIAERIRYLRETGGLSLRAIADILNAEGIPTARGAAKWTHSSVQTAAGWQRRPPRRHPTALPDLPRRRTRSA
jgi:DNA invertase Pin-like site-specific DNA recombinase